MGKSAADADSGARRHQVELLPLLAGRIVLPEVELTRPDVLLERNADGTPNWQFGAPAAAAERPARLPEIGSLSIRDGRVHFRDPMTSSDVVLQIDSDRAAAAADATADADSRSDLSGVGACATATSNSKAMPHPCWNSIEAGNPYRLEVKARAGDTRAMFDGTVVPLKLETIDGRLELSGKDLSKLYPLVPVALPWTSSYRISGHFLREGRKFALRDFNGRVGGSDVQGSASLDLTRKRPFFTADVTSRRLDYKDLAGFLGAPPPPRRASDDRRIRSAKSRCGRRRARRCRSSRMT